MKTIRSIVIAYVCMLVLFTVGMIVVFAIPTPSLTRQVARSAKAIEEEGIFWQPLGVYLLQTDNMTDCMMLNFNAYADSSRPVEAAMLNYYGYDYDGPQRYKTLARDTWRLAEEGREAMPNRFCYARYWHGYQVVLRPLLLLFDYTFLRWFNYGAMSLLFGLVLWLMWRRMGQGATLLFMVSLLAVVFPLVPLTMQCSTCFYLALSGMLLPLWRPQAFQKTSVLSLYFFVLGGVTAFMDLLTTPQLTLGFPLIVCLMLQREGKRNRQVISLSVSWLSGYALLWASKWVVAYILTGYSVFGNAIGSAMVRLSDTIVYGGQEMKMMDLVHIMLARINGYVPLPVLFLLLGLLVLFLAYYIYYNMCARKEALHRYGWLLLVAAIVPVWFIVLKNHSFQHIFFTWRAWCLTLYACLLYVHASHKTSTYARQENSGIDTLL